ncbi:MAG: hypothetical protein AMJ43_02630 [Coxiella sp. DG_40]|nr:MAG: hypothetical protein AMJ43_02630 [Coxiella sp. DG_40]
MSKDSVLIKILFDLEKLLNNFHTSISDIKHYEPQRFDIGLAIRGFLCPLLKPLRFSNTDNLEEQQRRLAKLYLEMLINFGKCLARFNAVRHQIDQSLTQKIHAKIAEISNALLNSQRNLCYMFVILFGGNHSQQKLPFNRAQLLENPKMKKLLTGFNESVRIYLETACKKLPPFSPEKNFINEIEKWHRLMCAAVNRYKTLKQKILILWGTVIAVFFAASAGFSLSTPVCVTFREMAWSTPIAPILSAIFTTATTIANFLIYRNTVPGLFLAISGGDFLFQGFLTYVDEDAGIRRPVPGRVLITPLAFFAASFVAFCYFGLTAASLVNILSRYPYYWISLGIPYFFGGVALVTYFAIQTRAYYMLPTASIRELVAAIKRMSIVKLMLLLLIDGLALFGIYATLFTGLDDFINIILGVSINITNPMHHAFLLIISCFPTLGVAPFVLITTTKFIVAVFSLHEKRHTVTKSKITLGTLVSSSFLFILNPLGNGLLTFPAAARDFIVKNAAIVLSFSQVAMGSISVIGAYLASAGSAGLYLIDGDETKRSLKMIQDIVQSLSLNKQSEVNLQESY